MLQFVAVGTNLTYTCHEIKLSGYSEFSSSLTAKYFLD